MNRVSVEFVPFCISCPLNCVGFKLLLKVLCVVCDTWYHIFLVINRSFTTQNVERSTGGRRGVRRNWLRGGGGVAANLKRHS